MTINELRIGNLLQFPEGIFKVTIIDGQANTVFCNEMSYGVEVAELKGVELTPELLERCGALYYNNESVDYVLCPLHGQDIGLKQYVDKSAYYLVGGRWQPTIQHLHHLQNLYYSLSGEVINLLLF